METVQIGIRQAIFQRLQALSQPLIDDTSSVIERLIDHWDASQLKPMSQPTAASKRNWVTPRGTPIPIGFKLTAKYKKFTLESVVVDNGIEFQGKTYGSPSEAAMAAKRSVGGDSSVQTNGWKFWYIDFGKPGVKVPLMALRETSNET